MSRQSKARQKAIIAKQYSELRKSGGKGPARTSPSHGKVNTMKAQRVRELEAKAAAASSGASQKANNGKTSGRGSKYAQKAA